MQTGTLALICAGAVSVIVALIGIYGSKTGGLLTRRTELDKIYMARLQTVETDNDKLRAERESLREQHRVDLTALDKVTRLEREVEELRRTLRTETDRTGEN
jgi:predicted RNase H-like nuclease (RuvC/YqgF family)